MSIMPAPFRIIQLLWLELAQALGPLTNAATAVFLDEYNTTTGALVQTIPLPTTVSGANKRLVLSGTNSSEGYLTLSTDVNYLVLGVMMLLLELLLYPVLQVRQIIE